MRSHVELQDIPYIWAFSTIIPAHRVQDIIDVISHGLMIDHSKLARSLYFQESREHVVSSIDDTVECFVAHNVLTSHRSSLRPNKLLQSLDWV